MHLTVCYAYNTHIRNRKLWASWLQCDDVFYDEILKRIYAIGAEGGISVFEQQEQQNADHYKESARISNVREALTGSFSPKRLQPRECLPRPSRKLDRSRPLPSA